MSKSIKSRCFVLFYHSRDDRSFSNMSSAVVIAHPKEDHGGSGGGHNGVVYSWGHCGCPVEWLMPTRGHMAKGSMQEAVGALGPAHCQFPDPRGQQQ